jgi:1-acyl-sn-glycerol-3-phosphate acyltransferase
MNAQAMIVQRPARERWPGAMLVDAVRSGLFYVAFFGGTVGLGLVGIYAVLVRPAMTRWICDTWSRWHRWCARWLLGIKVRIEGPVPEGAVLVAARHESMFEAIDMPTLFAFPSVFAKVELMQIPVWGRLGVIYGLITVEREEGAKALRAMVAAAKGLAGQGRPLVIFPEGTRVPHDSAPPLQSGFAGIYKLIGLPVVPLAVDSGRLYHRGIKRPGTITYRFGETIPPGLSRDDAEARVHTAINALRTDPAA